MPIDLKVGTEYTLKSINQRVRIVWENIEPGGVNFDKALVTVETKGGNFFTLPAARADKYLTTQPPTRRILGVKL